MESRQFDDFTRVLATGVSRRTVLRTMAAGLTAGLFGATRIQGSLATGTCGQEGGRDEGCPCQEDQPGRDPLCAPGLVCVVNDDSTQPNSEDSGICCPPGSTVEGGVCIPPGCPNECPAGTTQQDDCSCVCDNTCPAGTTQQADCSCVCSNVCPEGTTQFDDCSCVCTNSCDKDEVQADDCSCVSKEKPNNKPVPPTTTTPASSGGVAVQTLPSTGAGSDDGGSTWIGPMALMGAGAAFVANHLRRTAGRSERN